MDRREPATDHRSALQPAAAAARVRLVVRAVVAQALQDARRERLAILRPQSPEAGLLREWLGDVAELVDEGTAPAILPLDPLNKTALLLAPDCARAPILPLGDLYASRIAGIVGDWSAPAPIAEAIRDAGGAAAVDAFLQAVVEGRAAPGRAEHLLAAAGREAILSAYRDGWWWRRRIGVVPKLEARTAGVDPF